MGTLNWWAPSWLQQESSHEINDSEL